MDIAEARHIARRRWPVLVAVAVVSLGLGVLGALLAPTHYTARTAVFLGSNHIESLDDLASGSAYATTMAPSLVTAIDTPQVLDPVIATLQLNTASEQLAADVHYTLPLQSSTVTIIASASSARAAVSLADAVAVQFVVEVKGLSPTLNKIPAIAATQIAPAYYPPSALPARIGVGVGIGLLLAVAFGWLFIARADAVALVGDRSAVQRITKTPVIGQIPVPSTAPDAGLGTGSTDCSGLTDAGVDDAGVADAGVADAYRGLHDALTTLAPGVRCLLVGSAHAGAGSTAVAANVAVRYAEAGRKVLLVDADLNAPEMAALLSTGESTGLAAILDNRMGLTEVARSFGAHGLHVVAGSAPYADSGARFGSPTMERFIRVARARYDLVVIAAPALDSSSVALLLARQVDGIVVVADAQQTRRRALAQTLRGLQQAGGAIIGVVLNRASIPVIPRERSEPLAAAGAKLAAADPKLAAADPKLAAPGPKSAR